MITYPLNNILYQAEDAELFHCTRNSGVFSGTDFSYEVTGADNNVTILEGLGWIRNSKFSGKVIALKEPFVLDMGVSDAVYPRIDAIAIQFDANLSKTQIVVKKGTASSNPSPPSVVRTELLFELHLYHVKRNVGDVSVTASAITDLRLNEEYCGIMADSVTHVDTSAIQQQIDAFIESARSQTSSFIDEARSETQELITNTSAEIDGLVSNTETRLDTIADETEQKYTAAQGDINNLVSATQTRLDDIVADTYGRISEEVTSQLTEAKESGEFDGPQGPQGPAGSDANVTAENIQNALGYVPAPKSYILHGTIDDDDNITLTNFNWDELVAAITSAENVYVAARLVSTDGEYQNEYAFKQYSYFEKWAEFSYDYAGNLYVFEVHSDGTTNYYDASLNSEEWKFTLEDGTIVWKRVYVV